MNAVTFDTHEFVKDLESSGFTEEQAEALARAQKRANEANLDSLVTKLDLHNELMPVKAEMADIRSDLRLMKWMMALVIVTTVVPALKSLFS